jgi:hypothetical protein
MIRNIMMDDGSERKKKMSEVREEVQIRGCKLTNRSGEVRDKNKNFQILHVIIIKLSAPPKSSGDSCNHGLDYNFSSIRPQRMTKIWMGS